MKFNTKLLHGSSTDDRTGATNVPIYQSTAFKHKTAEDLEGVFNGTKFGYLYTRINNPTIEAFEKKIASLEKGIAAAACASGMAAISLALLNILKCGDEIVSGAGIFGGTISLFKGLEDFGIKTRYAENNSIECFKSYINENTKAIFVETIGNPKMDVPDIEALAKLAHDNSIPLVVDNTLTTPYIVRPIELGADIVVHSTSKYINGSSNSIGGIIVDSGNFKWNDEKFPTVKLYKKFGKFAYMAKLRKGLFKDLGVCISPFNAYMNSVGLETLGLRLDKICDNALKLAKRLEKNPKVVAVNYPGLASSAYNEVAVKQFGDKFSGLLTIRVGSKENAFKVINKLKYAANLANLGDTKTLVIHPMSTIYATNTAEEIENAGVYDDLIRISVGIEDAEDIIEDFEQALSEI